MKRHRAQGHRLRCPLDPRIAVLVAAGVVAACTTSAHPSPSPTQPAPVATSLIAMPAVVPRSPTTPTLALVPLPEGRLVFGRFATMGGEELLNVLGPRDQGERMVGDPKDCGTCASVSSDGQLIATLTATTVGRFDFYVMNSDGTGRREFPLPAGMQFGPGPFSGQSLYVQGLDDKGSPTNGIYRVKAADFSGLTQVTHTPKGEAGENPIVVSPDGSHLLVFRPITENGEHGNLFLTDTQGESMRRLNPEGTRVAWVPSVGVPASFSPDSRRVAFGAYEGDQGQNVDPERSMVMVADVAGGAARPIGTAGTGTVTARWSPTSDVIAFQRRDSDGYGLYLIRPDGTGEMPIGEATGSSGDSAWVPVWSPSGEWLAFQRGTPYHFDLWLLRRDGSDVGRLTDHPAGYGGVTWAP